MLLFLRTTTCTFDESWYFRYLCYLYIFRYSDMQHPACTGKRQSIHIKCCTFLSFLLSSLFTSIIFCLSSFLISVFFLYFIFSISFFLYFLFVFFMTLSCLFISKCLLAKYLKVLNQLTYRFWKKKTPRCKGGCGEVQNFGSVVWHRGKRFSLPITVDCEHLLIIHICRVTVRWVLDVM